MFFNLSSLIDENSIPMFFEISVVVTYRSSLDAMARDRVIQVVSSSDPLCLSVSLLTETVSCGCIRVSL